MFIPLILDVFNVRLNEKLMFWTCSFSIVVTVYFAVTAKLNSIPINNMYAMIAAIGIPTIVYLFSRYIAQSKDVKEIVV